MFKAHGNHALCSPVLLQPNNGPFVSHIHCSIMTVVLVKVKYSTGFIWGKSDKCIYLLIYEFQLNL